MFRRLYWVSEEIAPDHSSTVLGIYTSIPDLLKKGLRFPKVGHLRLTLCKLDSDREPLGRWHSPEFLGLEDGMRPFIETEEFSHDQVKDLLHALERETKASA